MCRMDNNSNNDNNNKNRHAHQSDYHNIIQLSLTINRETYEIPESRPTRMKKNDEKF